MIDKYEEKKDNGLIEIQETELPLVKIKEFRFNEITGEREFKSNHETSTEQIKYLLKDYLTVKNHSDNRLADMQKLALDLNITEIKK